MSKEDARPLILLPGKGKPNGPVSLLRCERGTQYSEESPFFPIYEKHFARFVGHPLVMFEIGTGAGGSCQMWKCYFGPTSRIVTIDIGDNKKFEESQIYPRSGNQSDTDFLGGLIEEFGPPDIVLDDGSHMMGDIAATFNFLFPRMSEKGVYFVEDLDGAYWPDRGGGLGHPDSFIERAKHLVDQMNADYSRDVQREPGMDGIVGISFYPMVVVLEKSPFLNKKTARFPEVLPGIGR